MNPRGLGLSARRIRNENEKTGKRKTGEGKRREAKTRLGGTLITLPCFLV